VVYELSEALWEKLRRHRLKKLGENKPLISIEVRHGREALTGETAPAHRAGARGFNGDMNGAIATQPRD